MWSFVANPLLRYRLLYTMPHITFSIAKDLHFQRHLPYRLIIKWSIFFNYWWRKKWYPAQTIKEENIDLLDVLSITKENILATFHAQYIYLSQKWKSVGIWHQGVVSLTFRELSKIISRKYTTPEITFMIRISSWNLVRVPKAWLWAHVQSFNLKFWSQALFLQYTNFERIFWRARKTLVKQPPGSPHWGHWSKYALMMSTNPIEPYHYEEMNPLITQTNGLTWWCYEMETFSALLALCEGNPQVTGGFPSQKPLTQSIDNFFDLRLNKQFSKQSRCWWFETPSHPLWCHCNACNMLSVLFIIIHATFSHSPVNMVVVDGLFYTRISSHQDDVGYWWLRTAQTSCYTESRSWAIPLS